MTKLIWSNIARRKSSSLLTIAITALTILAFVVVLGVCTTMARGLELSRQRLGADMVLIPEYASMNDYELLFTANPENVYMPAENAVTAAALNGAEACSPQFYSQTLSGAACCTVGSEVRVIGFDPETDFILAPYFEQKDYDSLKDDEIVVGSSLTDYAASAFKILGRQFKVAGTLYPTGTGMDNTIFMNIDVARQITVESEALSADWAGKDAGDYISVVMVKLRPGVDPAAFEKDVYRANLSVQCVTTGDTIASLQNQLGVTMSMLLLLWAAVLVIAALSLFGRFHALARERRREIGLMRALGLRRGRIFGLIVGEALTMAVIGAVIGGGLGLLCTGPIIERLREAFYLTTSLWNAGSASLCFLLGFGLACVLGFLASIIPAAKSAALEPQTAIMQGGVS